MKILVTGGSGFIGSHVVDKLADAGFEPRIYDLRPSLHHDPGSVDTVVGDLLDADGLRSAMEDCDVVVHLAAYADVGVVAEQPVSAEECNSRGTLACWRLRATGTRVIYGARSGSTAPRGRRDRRGVPIGLPDHLYGEQARRRDVLHVVPELYDVPCTILRFGSPYGPRARPSAVIPIFVSKAVKGEPLTIAGDGQQTRRFVYVEDLADGVVAALERGDEGRIYNLAGDETVTIRELAEVVSDLVGDTEIVHTPGRNGDFGGAVVSNQRAAEELGWRASTPLREGVRRYLAWLEPEPEPEPAPVTDPVVEPGWPSAWIIALACAAGTLIPSMLAFRSDDFGTGQAGYVAVTCLIAILAALSLLPLGPGGRRPTGGAALAGWLLVAYVLLETVPWSRHLFNLGVPHKGTLALVAMGLAIALLVATAAMRWRGEEAAATDTVS